MSLRVILVCPAAPRPFGDTAARWFFLLARELLAAGHEVRCLTVTDEPAAAVAEAKRLLHESPGAERLGWQAFPLRAPVGVVRRKVRSTWRPFAEMLHAPGFRAALDRELSRGYDVLHLEQLWSGWAGLDVPRSLLNVHHLEVIDLEHTPPGSAEAWKTWWQMRRATAYLLRRTQSMRLFTPRLRDHVHAVNAAVRCRVVPFALDLGRYPVQPIVDRPVVGLLGSMHWPPSRSAAERLLTRIWPTVKRRVPRAELLVAGWNARRYLEHFASLPGVTIKENLASPEEFFSEAAVMAYAPGRGSGMKIKVMESMAYGVPVVTTGEGVEGLDYDNGVQCWVDEDDERIAERICALLDDRAERETMREAARARLEERYTAAPVMTQMMTVYDEVLRCG